VRTAADGQSTLDIMANVTVPVEWEESKMVALMFAFPYGPWKGKTEVLMASRTY